MGRKRRRRTLNPPRPQPVGDPFEDFMNDLLGHMKSTVVQSVRHILMPATPMFEIKDGKVQKHPLHEPEAKPAQVISVRTET
jgi:hypothetical protein